MLKNYPSSYVSPINIRIVLDTSCLVSLYLYDIHHSRSLAIIEKIAHGEITGTISILTLIEFCSVIRRVTNEAKAVEVKTELDFMIKTGLLSVLSFSADDASALAIKTSLKCVDAIIVSTAKNAGAKLFTFDEEIKKKAHGIVDFYGD